SRERVRVVAIEVVDLLLLALRYTADLFEQRALQFVVRNLHSGLLANVGKNETKTHAAFGKTLVLGASLEFSGVLILEGAASLCEVGVDLRPDVVELGLDQLRRSLELVGFIECVEQLALCLLAGHGAILALDLALDDLAQLLGALKTELLCNFVIDLQIASLGDSLHLDVEVGFLTRQVGCRILLGE